MKNKTQKV